jgi:hypothetical protein
MPRRRLALAYAVITAVVFLLGFAMALSVGPAYTTNALLIAKEQAGSQQASGLATATRLLGLGGGADQGSNFSKFKKYWGSRDVAESILHRHPELLRRLFRSEWDDSTGNWYERPHRFQQWLAVPLNAMFGVYPRYAPTAQELAEFIKRGMKLDEDDLNGEVHVQFSDGDAGFARWFLTTVISETDNAVRASEQRRDRDFINFARDRLKNETNVSYRDALTDSLRQFEMSNMYAEAGDNFSFQYVETPFLPTVHSAPRPLFYTVLAFIFANMIAACVTGALLLWPANGFARAVDAMGRWVESRLWRPSLQTGDRARQRTP